MPERVLPENLSGEEIRIAILDKLGRRLEKDGYLSPTTSYNYFNAEISIKVRATDVGRDVEVNVAENITPVDNPPENEDVHLEESEGSFSIAAAPPNQVREETGQEVPVLTTQDGKPTIKKVRYPRKKA
jgi:hypothetical protein